LVAGQPPLQTFDDDGWQPFFTTLDRFLIGRKLKSPGSNPVDPRTVVDGEMVLF
jgi:hypothetical protein